MKFMQSYYDTYEQLFVTYNEIPSHEQIIDHMYEQIGYC
jgi:hypothetical protein